MPRHCTICEHPKKEEIDRQIVNGNTFRNIAKLFSLSAAAVYRHKEHVSRVLVNAKKAKEIAHADGLLEQVEDLQLRAMNILTKAEAKEDFRAATSAIREARGCLELFAKLVGELKEGQTVNILIAPEWIKLKTVILESLEPFPDAKLAVSKSLERLSNGSNST